jgi:hypothetical protein
MTTTYTQTDLTKIPFTKGEYENCLFNNCNLARVIIEPTILKKPIFVRNIIIP